MGLVGKWNLFPFLDSRFRSKVRGLDSESRSKFLGPRYLLLETVFEKVFSYSRISVFIIVRLCIMYLSYPFLSYPILSYFRHIIHVIHLNLNLNYHLYTAVFSIHFIDTIRAYYLIKSFLHCKHYIIFFFLNVCS